MEVGIASWWGGGLTVRDRFFRDTSSVFAVPFLVELDASLAARRAIDAEHAQVADVHAELFYCTTPTDCTKLA